jgi:ABC-type Fe3+-citrate transport system substrate-binding protein
MRRPIFRLVAGALLVAIAGAGCSTGGGGGNASAAGPAKVNATSNAAACGQQDRTITHELGTTKVIGTPTRVVALEFSFVDALTLVGIKPVGIADDNDPSRVIEPIKSKVTGYTSVGLRQSPKLDAISALKPDLIIADSSRHKAIFAQLQQIAPTIAFDSFGSTYQHNLDSMTAIGQALNKCTEMGAALQKHNDTLAALKAKLPAGAAGDFLFGITSAKQFSGYTADAFAPSVLEYLGFHSVLKSGTGKAANGASDATQVAMSLETFVAAAPPAVFVAGPKDSLFYQWQTNAVTQQVGAIKDKKVYPVDQNVWSRWRGVTASELIAQDVLKIVNGS